MSYSSGIAGFNAAPSQNACNASGCHTGNTLNASGGSISITDNIPTNGYVPGVTYTVNVTVARSGSNLFGFGLEAANSSNAQAGILQNISGATSTLTSTRQNVVHTTNSGASAGSKTWSFLWTAPSATTGIVTFYSAGNAANSNNGSSGDFIYTTTKTISPTPLSTNSILTNPICSGTVGLSIPFTTGTTFNSGNVFTAELSDATGSFSSPLTIGSLTATSSGTIISTVPLPNVFGTGYRIRVVSSNPTYTGITSASILTLNLSPGIAIAGSSQSVCGTSSSLSANSPTNGIGTWSVLSGNGTISNTNSANATITNLTSSLTILRWSLSNSGCSTSTSTLSIYSAQPPTTASAGISQTACLNTTTIQANLPAIGTGSWSLISGSGNILLPTSATTGINNLGVGNNVFMWTISNSPCLPSTSTLSVNHTGSITPANAGNDQNICGQTTTLSANSPGNGSGQWSVISGSAVIAQISNSTSNVSNLAFGTNVLRWTISNGACTPSFDELTIQTTSISPAIVSNAQTLCTQGTTLAAVLPVTGIGSWALLSGGGSIAATSQPTTAVTGLINGLNQFVWTVQQAPCPPNSATLTLTKSGDMTTAQAGINQTICGPTTLLNAIHVTQGNGSWTVLSGSASISSPTLASTSVSQLPTGTTVLRWTVTNGTCTPSIDDLVIESKTISPALTSSDLQQCATDATLVASLPQHGTGVWSVLTGTAQLSSLTNDTVLAVNLINGLNVFRWTITNAPCAPQVKDISVLNCINNPIPLGSINGTPFCKETGYALSLQFTPAVAFSGFYSAQLSDATGNFTQPILIGSAVQSPISALIPSNTPSGNGYRVRIINSSPNFAGLDNGQDIDINNCINNSISVDSVGVGPYCANTSYTLTIPFVTTGTVNGPYVAELSDLAGNFIQPITIGYGYSSPIQATIPPSMPIGSGYRVRVRSYSNSAVRLPNAHNMLINTCGITQLNETPILGFNIYPIPVRSILHIYHPLTDARLYILTDISGRILEYLNTENGQASLSMEAYGPGIYFLSTQQNGLNIVQKVIRE